MAREKGGGGKETGVAQIKRVESLELELGTLYDRLENQGYQIQHQADSIASIQMKIDQNQLKMEQKFEEILGAIAKGNQGKTIREGEPSGTPVISMEGIPKGYSGTLHSNTDGVRMGNEGGEGQNGRCNWWYQKLEMP